MGGSPAGYTVGEHELVHGREHAHEILEEVTGARVAMGLEGEEEAPPRERAPRRRERGRHFRGMVAVVVDESELPAAGDRDVAVTLEAPAHAREFREAPSRWPRRARPTSRPTAITAKAFSTLCNPGRFSSTSSVGGAIRARDRAKAHAPSFQVTFSATRSASPPRP
jgi:hypothetical protein